MANNITNIYFSNTFGDLVRTANNLINAWNYLGFLDWDKPSGQFSISSNGTGFLSNTTSVFRRETRVEGVGSSFYVQNNAEVGQSLLLTGKSNTVTLYSNGSSVFSGGMSYTTYLNDLGYSDANNRYAIITTAKSLFANNVDILSIANTDILKTNNSTIYYNLSGNTAQFTGNVYSANVTSNSYIYSGDNISTNKNIYVAIDALVAGTTRTNFLQSNNTTNTTFLSVTNGTFTNYLQSNSSVVTATLQANNLVIANTISANSEIVSKTIQGSSNTFTNYLQSNSSILTATLQANNLVIANTISANSEIVSKTIQGSSNAFTNYLQSNSSVVTATLQANTTVITTRVTANSSIVTPTVQASSNVYTNSLVANSLITTDTLNAQSRTITNIAIANTVQANSVANAQNISVTQTIFTKDLRANGNLYTAGNSNSSNIFVTDTVYSRYIGRKDSSGNPGYDPAYNPNGVFGIYSTELMVDTATVRQDLYAQGNFQISGKIITLGENITLNANVPAQDFGGLPIYVGVNRKLKYNTNSINANSFDVIYPTAINAELNWNETAKRWQVRDVDVGNYKNIISLVDVITDTACTSISQVPSCATANAIHVHASKAYTHANSAYDWANGAITIGTTPVYLNRTNTVIGGISTISVTDRTISNYLIANTGLAVGVSSPSYKLDVRDGGSKMWFQDNGVASELMLISETSGASALYFGDDTNNKRGGLVYNSSTNSLSINGFNNTTRMLVDSSGNIGIGTTPSYKLDVSGSTRISSELYVGTKLSVTTTNIDLKPDSSYVRIWDTDSSNYYQIVPGNIASNYNLTLAGDNTTLVGGTMVATSRSLTITNGTGITGGAAYDLSANRSWTIGLSGQALDLHNMSITGLFTRTSTGTITARSIAVSGNGLSISNADGTSGNPTISSNATSAATGNTLVFRDGNGDFSGRYIAASYLNSTDNSVSSGLTGIMCKTSDSYHRTATAAAVASFISGQSMNISGTATNVSGGSVTATSGSFSSTLSVTNTLSSSTRLYAYGSQATPMATSTGSLGGIEVQGPNNTSAAFIAFHRPGAYAAYFGLDTNNRFRVGGWSMGGAAYNVVIEDGGTYGINTSYSSSAGNADTVDGWHRDDIRAWGNLTGKPFNYSGQGGQPSWLWGTNDGTNYYVWNPSNFNVNYANSAGTANAINGSNSYSTAGNISASSMYTSNWFRSTGQTGWYSETYAGGMYMVDTSYVRVYNSKALYVSNDIIATGSVYGGYSDERLKTKKGNIKNPVKLLSKLNGFRYINNKLAKSFGYNDPSVQLGLSAQEVEAVFPEIVSLAPFDIHVDEFSGEKSSASGENYKTVDYAKLVPVLVEAIKEQQKQIDELKAKIGK